MSKGEVSIRKKIAKKLEGAAVKYTQNVELRAAMNLIPNIDSVIDVWISSKGQNLQQKRLLYTVSCLTDEMKRIDMEKIDKEFLDTEEFYDILRWMFENSIKTRHYEKIQVNCKILAKSILINNVNHWPYSCYGDL